jgi:hypothetical protein
MPTKNVCPDTKISQLAASGCFFNEKKIVTFAGHPIVSNSLK